MLRMALATEIEPTPGREPSSPPRWPRVTAAALAAAVVAAALALASQLPKRELWFDETFTAAFGASPPSRWPSVWRNDTHPPLDYLLRTPLVRLSGAEWAVRLPSAVALVAAVALLGWRLRGHPAIAVTSAWLMALSPFFIHYGAEARMYALMVLWGVLGAVVATRWQSDDMPSAPMWIAAIVAGATLTHVSGFLLAGGWCCSPVHDETWRRHAGGSASAPA